MPLLANVFKPVIYIIYSIMGILLIRKKLLNFDLGLSEFADVFR